MGPGRVAELGPGRVAELGPGRVAELGPGRVAELVRALAMYPHRWARLNSDRG